jgi:hypothetical protein
MSFVFLSRNLYIVYFMVSLNTTLSQAVPADASFLCDVAVVLRDVIEWAPVNFCTGANVIPYDRLYRRVELKCSCVKIKGP